MVRRAKHIGLYGVEQWGAGFFAIGPTGHLHIHPFRDDRSVDLVDVVQRSAEQGLIPPLLVRFPQVLQTQLEHLYNCFDEAMSEFDYRGHYRSVFPLKVNPMKPVVEQLIRASRSGAFGLEVGSKGELAIALALQLPKDSWICVNGFKDQQIIKMVTAASGRDPQMILIVEQLREIPILAREARMQGRCPLLGLRCRLNSRGSGHWEASGGESSKFGLGSSELLCAVDTLQARGLLDRLQILHYHIGSQITSARRIKDAVKEAARIYARLRRRGVPLTTLNVGGGLGIDYDGSRTPSDSSVNYTTLEFANNIVYTVREICGEENVPLPNLVSESGRALTAHHSLLITNCESRESDVPVNYVPAITTRAGGSATVMKGATREQSAPAQIAEMEAIAQEISVKNFREYYHDAVATRGEILTLFDLGYLSLEEKALAEQHFYQICRQTLTFARQTGFTSDEFRVLEKAFRTKYVTNFSVFRSVPDAWAVGHLFPILPIHRLGEFPSEKGILVDLTCDSDGVIDSFVDVRDVKEMLELHAGTNGHPYLLAICLLGAYQDIMGDHHNLFGKPAELAATYTEGGFEIDVISRGETIREIAHLAGYDPERLQHAFAKRHHQASAENSDALAYYTALWRSPSYLEGDPESFKNLP